MPSGAQARCGAVERRETEGRASARSWRGAPPDVAGQGNGGPAPPPPPRAGDAVSESGCRRCSRARRRTGALATEIAGWEDKTDVSEELARLRAHLTQLSALLTGDGRGRTLDFLIQEINREVNTIGSKADDLEISQAVIAAKSTLEKMREQVANLE